MIQTSCGTRTGGHEHDRHAAALSLGTPMMLAGDEFRNTQDGNNNAYCQDNDITWLKWDWMYSTNKTREMRRLETVSLTGGAA